MSDVKRETFDKALDALRDKARLADAALALLRRLVTECDRDDSDSGSLSIVACEVVADARKLLDGTPPAADPPGSFGSYLDLLAREDE